MKKEKFRMIRAIERQERHKGPNKANFQLTKLEKL